MFPAATSQPRLITLILLTALSLLSLNMFLPSLSNMADTFQVDYALISWSIAGYLVITALLQLIIGPLSDRFGRRPILLIGLAIFAIASVGCVLATNIWLFLACRMIQGAIISGSALSPAVIRDMVPARQAASLLGYVSMAMAIAPMLGPMFGGVLDELFGWRSSFVVFALFGVMLFAFCWVDLGETNKQRSKTFAKQFETYPELFRSRRFWGYTLCAAFSTGAFYAFISGVPLVTKTLFTMSPGTLGFYMGTITAGYFVGNFFSARYSTHYSLTTMMISGRIVGCAGLILGLALFLSGFVHVVTLFGATVFVGIGNGLTKPSCSIGAMSVRPELAGSASGLSGALSVGTGAIMTWFTASILSEENGAYELLGLMLFSSVISLIAAFYVLWVDLREAQGDLTTSN